MGGGGGGKRCEWGWVQSKFVIIKNMKELRFCWWSKRADGGAQRKLVSVATLPVCVPLTPLPPQIPPINLCAIKEAKHVWRTIFFYIIFFSVSAAPDGVPMSELPLRRLLSTTSASPNHFWVALEPVWLKLPLGPWDLPACSLQWPPAQEALRLVNQQLKACLDSH